MFLYFVLTFAIQIAILIWKYSERRPVKMMIKVYSLNRKSAVSIRSRVFM